MFFAFILKINFTNKYLKYKDVFLSSLSSSKRIYHVYDKWEHGETSKEIVAIFIGLFVLCSHGLHPKYKEKPKESDDDRSVENF